MLLYVISTVFVCYLSFRNVVSVPVWNALFWIIMLFASINAVGRSFIQERKGRLLYYYSIASPQAFLLAKMAYNSLLMLVITFLAYAISRIYIPEYRTHHNHCGNHGHHHPVPNHVKYTRRHTPDKIFKGHKQLIGRRRRTGRQARRNEYSRKRVH